MYCGSETAVVNSRFQKRSNCVWRRRRCLTCHAIFSTEERSIYERSLMVRIDATKIEPFKRDRLFLSMYGACRHRPSASDDAAALTDTVIGKLLMHYVSSGAVSRQEVIEVTGQVLENFDHAAYVYYRAYHPL